MPRQNRILATGEVIAHPSKAALFMGNRGILHDTDGQLTPRRWRHRNWVCCTLELRPGRSPRAVMSPGRYTELFFLDEAVALAAGHRPCAECRRPDYLRYRAALGFTGSASDLDAWLHAERAIPRTWKQRRVEADIATLPDGAMILHEGVPHLLLRGDLRPAGPDGYGPPCPRPLGNVIALTPAPSLLALSGGYLPVLHPTAFRPTGTR